MKFQVTIPPLSEDDFQMNVTVEGTNWRTALRAAIKKIGESAELIKNIECDIQDDGSFKVTDLDSKRVFTVKEVAEAAPAADAQKQEEQKRKEAEQKRADEEAATKRREEEERTRREEAARLEAQRQAELKREETIREEEKHQAEQKRAAEEARRRNEEERLKEEEQKRADEDKKQRDERKKEEDRAGQAAQKRAAEEQQHAEEQRKKDELAKKQRDEEQKRIAEETRKKEASAAKISETQKLSRPKVKGETIETRLGQKVSGPDTVEFLSDAFDAIGDLFSISNPQKAVEFVLDQALRKVPSEAGSILFNDVGKRQLTFWATRGPKAEKLAGKSLPYGKGIAGYCVSKSVSLAIPDVSQDPRWDPTISEAVSYETRSILCAPLFFEGRCYGALQLLNRKSDSSFSRRELSVTNYLAEQLARWLNENGE